jgi:molybdopterin/thiamine biosynthesis adenylyltransferase
VTSFIPGYGCYRCLFPAPPPPDMAPSCQEAGVLGVLCGVIGSLQATEAIKIALGAGKPMRDRKLEFDALALKFREFKRHRDPSCPVCGEGVKPEDIQLIDYQEFCNVRA